jgi:hypothetical protein
MSNIMEAKNKQFFRWFVDWINQNKNRLLMFFQLPNNLASESIKGNDEIMLEHIQFYMTDKFVDHKIYITHVINKAEEFGVKIFFSNKIPKEYIQFLNLQEYQYDIKYLIKKK